MGNTKKRVAKLIWCAGPPIPYSLSTASEPPPTLLTREIPVNIYKRSLPWQPSRDNSTQAQQSGTLPTHSSVRQDLAVIKILRAVKGKFSVDSDACEAICSPKTGMGRVRVNTAQHVETTRRTPVRKHRLALRDRPLAGIDFPDREWDDVNGNAIYGFIRSNDACHPYTSDNT